MSTFFWVVGFVAAIVAGARVLRKCRRVLFRRETEPRPIYYEEVLVGRPDLMGSGGRDRRPNREPLKLQEQAEQDRRIATAVVAKANPIANLDFLRACAVMFVLIDHTLQKLGVLSIAGTDINWLGRAGVLFFFVHTCCVLMMSLERQKGAGYFLSFYIRRGFRIYPLCVAAVLASMIPPYSPNLRAAEWLSNLALTQNLTFAREAFGSIWSLPIEVQMYVFLPFLFLFARHTSSLWPILAIFAASIPIALWQPHHVARASVLSFAPAFLPGIAAYWVFRNIRPVLPPWCVPILIGTVVTGFMFHPNWTFSAWGACLALGLSIPLCHPLRIHVVNAAAHNVAKYSYGIYLSHVLLLTWMRPHWSTVPLYLMAVAGVSVASFHALEQPMIGVGQGIAALWQRRKQQTPLAVATSASG